MMDDWSRYFPNRLDRKDELYPIYSPAEIIRLRLDKEERSSLNLIRNNPSSSEMEGNFYWQLRSAWDILAYDHYKPGSSTENMAGVSLWDYYRRSHKPTIKLSDPQIRIIDALTDAVGIPHQRGQAEIEIPERLRDFIGWQLSKEYQGVGPLFNVNFVIKDDKRS